MATHLLFPTPAPSPPWKILSGNRLPVEVHLNPRVLAGRQEKKKKKPESAATLCKSLTCFQYVSVQGPLWHAFRVAGGSAEPTGSPLRAAAHTWTPHESDLKWRFWFFRSGLSSKSLFLTSFWKRWCCLCRDNIKQWGPRTMLTVQKKCKARQQCEPRT